jgi:hypothetical protein
MRLSQRIYRLLLKAYPGRYLRRYGEPMAQLFSDQLRDANSSGGLVRLWSRTLADVLRTSSDCVRLAYLASTTRLRDVPSALPDIRQRFLATITSRQNTSYCGCCAKMPKFAAG